MSVSIDGLPGGTLAAVSVTSTKGYQSALTAGQVLAGLTPGSYTVAAGDVVADGDHYSPAPSSQNVAVTSGVVPVSAGVSYALTTGRMQVVVGGVPGGTASAITISGPNGYAHLVTATETLNGLTPGIYTIQSPALVADGEQYEASSVSQVVAVAAIPGVTLQVTVGYTIATGRVIVNVSGLPVGGSGVIQVTGPAGYNRLVTRTDTLRGLAPGSYSIAAGNATVDGVVYVPTPTSQGAFVTASPIAELRSVSYGQGTGALSVNINGLPGGLNGNVTVTGPGGFNQLLVSSQTLTGLLPGNYTVSALAVSSGGTTYAPAPAAQSVTVPFAATASASVQYTATTGGLTVTVTGLPGGVPAAVTVLGPGGFSQGIAATQTLGGLAPGSYTINAVVVNSGGVPYTPVPTGQTVTVNGGATASATVVYTGATGSLAVTIAGLPGSVNANVTVTGPGGFFQPLTTSGTLSGLSPGSYTVAAVVVSNGGTTYTPAPASQPVTVTVGTTASASVTYTGSGGGTTLNLTVNGVYLTQATQRYDGSVPLVAGRDAYLRVFALANQANSALPQVRVRLYNGVTLVQTYTITAPAASVPTVVNEGSLTSSWNVLVPAALVQPNLRVLADVDPLAAVAESDDADNQFPVSGTPANVDVRSLPTFQVRFVPVLQQVNGLQGNVTGANQNSFLTDLTKLLPVGAYNADVRAVYTTTAPVLVSDNSNNAWGTILSEVFALKASDASTRYYYGVVKTNYGSGVAGMGYVGGSARSAIGWDALPSGSGIMAHEVGHNMSRQHAPCGGVASPDPAYPYAGGKIGMWGLDVLTLALKSPATYADLMGYCSPAWVSDYNWSAMVTYRQGGPNNAPAMTAGAVAGLLVWGRITPNGIVLEPAFRVSAGGMRATPGPNRLDLLAGDGSLLQSVSFEAEGVADDPTGAQQHFAFVVPLDAVLDQAVAGLRVRASGHTVARLATAAGIDPSPDLTRANAQQVQVRWNPSRYPMVMVRDAATGEILSFARGGAALLWTRGGNFDLQFSDGVKSTIQRVRNLK